MGCTTSIEGETPKRTNKIIGGPVDYKPLDKCNKVRIQMILDYWYEEEEWTVDKH